MTNQNIEVDVLINGRPVKQFGQNGRVFVEARVDSEYSIKVRNSNDYRVLAIVSVDGVNVVNGKNANLEGTGYIIPGYSAVNIEGYRRDLNSVGAFKFTKKKKSYAKEVSGTTQNVGVISVAVFKEKQKPAPVPTVVHHWHTEEVIKPVYYPIYPSYPSSRYYFGNYCSNRLGAMGDSSKLSVTNSANSATYNTSNFSQSVPVASAGVGGATASTSCDFSESERERGGLKQCSGGNILRRSGAGGQSASFSSVSEAPKFEVGSSWGKEVKHQVKTENFEKDSTSPFVILELFYDTKENLEDIGIDFAKETRVSFPKGFENQFATPPQNWNR